MQECFRGYQTAAIHYEVFLPAVGVGNFATVYRAQVKVTGEEVAIKKLNLESARFSSVEREISILSSLRHPSLPRIHTAFNDDTQLWMIMTYALWSCGDMLREHYPSGIKSETLLASIISGVLTALVYVHENRFIHNDIKAANVLISRDGTVQLTDFGLAKATGDDGKTAPGYCGSPCWMAPEVMIRMLMQKDTGYDNKADVWSVGMLGLELAMGKAPYSGMPVTTIQDLTLTKDAPSLDSYDQSEGIQWSRGFRDFLHTCLQKDPEQRPSAKKLLTHKWLRCNAKGKKFVRQVVVNLSKTTEEKKENQGCCIKRLQIKRRTKPLIAQHFLPKKGRGSTATHGAAGISVYATCTSVSG